MNHEESNEKASCCQTAQAASDNINQIYQDHLNDGMGRPAQAPLPPAQAAVFENSSARSHLAPRFDLIPLVVLERLAARFEIGAAKYGERNWQSGGPKFKRQCALHLIEHLWSWLEGRPEEDSINLFSHLDAVLWNAAALVWHEDRDRRAKEARSGVTGSFEQAIQSLPNQQAELFSGPKSCSEIETCQQS